MDCEKYEWLDVTQQILGIPADMKLLELIKDDEVTLEECMQAQEINDEKMDPKFDICEQNTITYKLKNNLIKLPGSLTAKQTAKIFANIFQLQSASSQGHPLSTTIYKFSYLFDPTIVQEDIVMKSLTHSIQTLGQHIYQILKQSCSIKEDDANISIFSFSQKSKSHEEVIELLLQAEKKIEADSKKAGEDKKFYQFVLACLRVRRFLHIFAKSSGLKFDAAQNKKVLGDIESAKKRLVALEEMQYEDDDSLLEGVFFDDLNKTLRGHFGPRKSPVIPFKEALKQVRNIFQQFDLYLPIPTKISEFYSRLEDLEERPTNLWPRSYIKVSMFAKDDLIFSMHKTEQMVIDDINDWVHLKEDIKSNEKFKNLVKTGSPTISETLYRLLANSMRWHWENSKIYEDFNYLIHIANQVDGQVTLPHRQLLVCSWFYYYGLKMIIKQIMMGFQIKIYEVPELKYVLFAANNLLGIYNRNSQVHLRKIDKTLESNFLEGNLNKKMKKKMTENSKKMFTDIFFKKGLLSYFQALFRLVCVLHNRKLIENKFQQEEEVRIKNRFRIFKHILFVKVIDYEEYKKMLEQIGLKEPEVLGEALEQLKQAKNLFQLIVNQFEDGEVFYRQRKDAEILVKLSVKASLAAMTLRMGTGNKSFSVDMSGNYPEIIMK